jgi:hypothetical protein
MKCQTTRNSPSKHCSFGVSAPSCWPSGYWSEKYLVKIKTHQYTVCPFPDLFFFTTLIARYHASYLHMCLANFCPLPIKCKLHEDMAYSVLFTCTTWWPRTEPSPHKVQKIFIIFLFLNMFFKIFSEIIITAIGKICFKIWKAYFKN